MSESNVQDKSQTENLQIESSSTTRKAVLVQELCGYSIYKSPTCFVVHVTEGDLFFGYYTTFASCVRDIMNANLTNQLVKRSAQDKRNLDSLLGCLDQYTEKLEQLLKPLYNIRAIDFETKSE
ncbi:MAG: hypothetical protein WC346_04080 [Methanogenium sp.]|jgi:hypothetical protein